MTEFKYGVLLPHFGSQASRQRLVEGSQMAEQLGFDSVWVRDHLVYRPHKFEDPDLTHVDPWIAMTAVAAVTRKVVLGTGSLIPYRHPIQTALLAGSLDFIAGPGRLILGFGLGSFQHEFDAAGQNDVDRKIAIEEQIEVMRQLWTGQPLTHDGPYYQFEDIQISPVPAAPVPIWYCGTSPASVRRAVEYCDGWIPGRMPKTDFTRRVARMRRLANEAGKPVPTIGNIPYVVVGRDSEDALRYLDMPNLLAEANRRYTPPDGKPTFETADDLDGALIYGTPERIVEGIRFNQSLGTEHFVFDLRQQYVRYEEVLQQIGEEILPELCRGDSKPATVAAAAVS